MPTIDGREQIGEGAYGIVYGGELTRKDGRVKKVAVKRNWGDKESTGTSMIREMSFLKFLKHPFLNRCQKITKENPFISDPLTPRFKGKNSKEDEYLFIMELAECNLSKYFRKIESDVGKLREVMSQILLGVEFLHALRIMHRDLKPENILIEKDEEDNIRSKICDYGLSGYQTYYRPSTPGTVTYYYRAPEICCNYDYSFPVDIWSIGCIFYEMITKKPLVIPEKDKSKLVFRAIIRKVQEKFTCEYLDDYISKGKIKSFMHGYTESLDRDKSTFETRILSRVDSKKFTKNKTSIKEFCDLLQNLLWLDPSKRFTATQALEHSFFSRLEPKINQTRIEYPPQEMEDPELHIIDCIERRWAVNIAFRIFNHRFEDGIEWYDHNHHILFHSLRIFDEYLYRYYDKEKTREFSTTTMGKLHTRTDVNIFFFTCIYMSYKYFCTLFSILSWKEIFPQSITQLRSNHKKVIKFENFILKYLCGYSFFRPSLIEYLDRDFLERYSIDRIGDPLLEEEKELDVKILLLNYGNINMNYNGTTKDLYEQIKKARSKNEK